MSAVDLEKVIMMAVLDDTFRVRLLSHVPQEVEEALRALNIEPTKERVEALKKVNRDSLRQLGKAFGHPDAGRQDIN